MITRRGLVTGLVGLVTAPAIVRATSIMPVKPMLPLAPKWAVIDPVWNILYRVEVRSFAATAALRPIEFRLIDCDGRPVTEWSSTPFSERGPP